MAKLIDGKAIAAATRADIAARRAAFETETGINPGLAVIIVGENPASQVYVRNKKKACEDAGFYSVVIEMPEETTEEELLGKIDELKRDEKIHGILVQLPLPKHLDEKAVIAAIPPEKDVDAFHVVNTGRIMLGDYDFLPCTPAGIMKMLAYEGIDPAGKECVVVGRSNIVGKPVAVLLSRKGKGANATVTLCHTGTPDISAHTKTADIVVVAAGRPNTLTGDMLKPGAVVIDVGVNRVPDPTKPKGYRLCGDADFASCAEVASAITPVPGGVGPMTITMLLWNTLVSARRAAAK